MQVSTTTGMQPNIFHSLLNNREVEKKINILKNEKTVEIDDLFKLLITGCKDSGSFLYQCPLDAVSQILDNGLSIEEKEGIEQWFEPMNKTQNFCYNLLRPLKASQSQFENKVDNSEVQQIRSSMDDIFIKDQMDKRRQAIESDSFIADDEWSV